MSLHICVVLAPKNRSAGPSKTRVGPTVRYWSPTRLHTLQRPPSRSNGLAALGAKAATSLIRGAARGAEGGARGCGLHGLAHRHGELCGLRRVAVGDGLDLHRLDLHRLDLDGHGGLDGMDLDRSAEDVGRVGLEQH